MSELDFQPTPSEAADAAKDLLPAKSGSVYQSAYNRFMKWCDDRNITDYSETTLLTYFSDLATKLKMKGSTQWAQFSMIKSLLSMHHGVDMSQYVTLRAFLKKQNEGYVPKKSRAFTKKQVEEFVATAPDEKYLGAKMVLIIGVSGACRCDELIQIKIDDIEDLGSLLHIKIPDNRYEAKKKTKRSFIVVGPNYMNVYRKYSALRPDSLKDRRFFVKYLDGKCHRCVLGVHKIASIPRDVASFLHLPNPQEFTGHCLRASGEMLVDGGACLRRHRRCISNRLTENYFEQASTTNREIKILIADRSPEASCSSRSDEELFLGECATENADTPEQTSNVPSKKSVHLEIHKEIVRASRLKDESTFESAETDWGQLSETYMDVDGNLTSSFVLKSEIEAQESEISASLGLDSGFESYENVLKKCESLKAEVQRLNSLLERKNQELLLSKQRETKLEQIVQSVKELVNQDICTANIKQEF